MNEIIFKKAESQHDYMLAFSLVKLLNPALTESVFEKHLSEMLHLKNYFLINAFDQKNTLVGVCGYWIATKFYCGKYMEIDNFIIDPNHRNLNYGQLFLQHLEKIAQKEKCETVMLDAYVENFNGHRFYYRNGYIARGFHFLKKV